jgi:hypothetical protein
MPIPAGSLWAAQVLRQARRRQSEQPSKPGRQRAASRYATSPVTRNTVPTPTPSSRAIAADAGPRGPRCDDRRHLVPASLSSSRRRPSWMPSALAPHRSAMTRSRIIERSNTKHLKHDEDCATATVASPGDGGWKVGNSGAAAAIVEPSRAVLDSHRRGGREDRAMCGLRRGGGRRTGGAWAYQGFTVRS